MPFRTLLLTCMNFSYNLNSLHDYIVYPKLLCSQHIVLCIVVMRNNMDYTQSSFNRLRSCRPVKHLIVFEW